MRPHNLRLENVGPFAGQLHIDFDALDDLFLITGQTGSGKSTIFDAICYALYGSLPGGRRGQTRRIRSDFVDDNAPCTVSLDFSLGERRYLVERSPPRLRRKSRGEGFVEDPESAVLYEVCAGERIPLSGKSGEANDKIKRLIGLSDDEFSKIVLLPQGEFAEFLRQNTSDRREVLRKLFPVDLAVRIRENAQAQSKDFAARLKEAERSVADCLERFDPQAYEEKLRALKKQEEEARNAVSSARLRSEQSAQALRTAEAAAKTALHLEETRQREAALASEEQVIQADETALAASRAAKPIAPRAIQAREAAAKASDYLIAAREAKAEAERAAETLKALEKNKEREAEMDRSLSELKRRMDALETALGAFTDGEKIRQERSGLDEALHELDVKRNEVLAFLARHDSERGLLEKTAEAFAERDALWVSARKAMEEARRLKPLAERHERLITEAKLDEEHEKRLEIDIEAMEKRLRAQADAISAAEKRETDRLRSERAAELAAALREGQPCPVCGSTSHPLPAAAPSFDRASAAELASLKRDREDALETAASYRAEYASLKASRERRKRDLHELERESQTSLPSAKEAAELFEHSLAELNTAAALREEAGQAAAKLQVWRREHEAAASKLRDMEEKRAETTTRRAALAAADGAAIERLNGAAETARAALRAADSALGKDSDTPKNAGSVEKTSPLLIASLEERINAFERERKESLEAKREAELMAAESAAKAAAAAGGAVAAEAEAARCRAALSALLKSGPFHTGDEAEAAVLGDTEEKAIETRIKTWREERIRIRGLIEELERQAAGFVGSLSKESAENEAAAAETALESTTEKQAEITGTLRDLDRDHTSYLAAEERRRELAANAAAMKALADDLSGNNPKKRSFDAWLLSLYLAEVAAYAARRLERMSEGRYRLILDSEREGGRGLAGLDLAVFDAYTGKSRPCATLSGGESFMASICLALGLADSIQARSGGVRLDALFIDEGFGSLDEAGLDKALSILDEIRDHRMVGLISHVAEMRTRIPSRIEIVKTNIGSRLL